MRINELLSESQDLEEGPILNKIGTGIGKAVGTATKGVGAVAGGIAGLGSAFKKGYQAGKTTVGAAGDEPETDTTTAPQTTQTAPAASGTATPPTSPTTTAAPTAQPAAKPATTTAPAAAPSATAAKPTGAAPLKAPPVAGSSLDSIKKLYSSLTPQEREQLKKDLDVIDDQDRLASGTNESLKDIAKLAGIK